MTNDLCEKCSSGIEESPGGCDCDPEYYYCGCFAYAMPYGNIMEIKSNRSPKDDEYIEIEEEIDGVFYVVFYEKNRSMLTFNTKLSAMTYCMGAQWGAQISNGM